MEDKACSRPWVNRMEAWKGYNVNVENQLTIIALSEINLVQLFFGMFKDTYFWSPNISWRCKWYKQKLVYK